MRIDILSLFPEMFEAVLCKSIIGRAVNNNLVQLEFHNIRDFTENKNNRVDDYPYGGGLGMVMQCQPIYSAMEHVIDQVGSKPHVILMTPQGKPFDQKKAQELTGYQNIAMICGHYEGIDQRVSDGLVDEEISLGDFVLTGGEIAAMAVTDAVCRLLPGVLKEDESHMIESFSSGLLEYPQYTRPPVFKDMAVPEILFTGHHENVDKWRRYQALKTTYIKRPELLENVELSKQDIKMLEQIKQEVVHKEKEL